MLTSHHCPSDANSSTSSPPTFFSPLVDVCSFLSSTFLSSPPLSSFLSLTLSFEFSKGLSLADSTQNSSICARPDLSHLTGLTQLKESERNTTTTTRHHGTTDAHQVKDKTIRYSHIHSGLYARPIVSLHREEWGRAWPERVSASGTSSERVRSRIRFKQTNIHTQQCDILTNIEHIVQLYLIRTVS